MSVLRALLVLFLCCGAVAGHAATLRDLDLSLRFDGRSWLDVQIYDLTGTTPELILQTARLTEAADIWGLPRVLPDLAVGDRLSLQARLDLSANAGAGGAVSCRLGIYDCTAADAVVLEGDNFALLYGRTEALQGNQLPGGAVFYDYLPEPFSSAVLDGGRIFASWSLWRAGFTVLDKAPAPSPVPLPAGALLLPAGLAGLAMLRRRAQRPGRL